MHSIHRIAAPYMTSADISRASGDIHQTTANGAITDTETTNLDSHHAGSSTANAKLQIMYHGHKWLTAAKHIDARMAIAPLRRPSMVGLLKQTKQSKWPERETMP